MKKYLRPILGSAVLVFVLVLLMSPMVYAGKVELTTYYPVPDGEYKDLRANRSLAAPVRDINGDTTKVRRGDIWFEA